MCLKTVILALGGTLAARCLGRGEVGALHSSVCPHHSSNRFTPLAGWCSLAVASPSRLIYTLAFVRAVRPALAAPADTSRASIFV
ncbi:hypothetical protein B0T19DRAFT_246146 [Cercophora scortea]|uniref:Secreted protein n=1 Tax=Cercophora scortea TaxID=314031 RepID=A0AAE0M600_9PEZI|nr:hypothetical protein B0T19DRAFT_246146 [Cercophora scortea]